MSRQQTSAQRYRTVQTATQKPKLPIIKTLWGELACQLGRVEGYEIVRAAGETSTHPGNDLKVLFKSQSFGQS
ncbi:MAG: hypothetical protein Q6J46_04630 [Thermostichus sp. DG02_2_bins_29]